MPEQAKTLFLSHPRIRGPHKMFKQLNTPSGVRCPGYGAR